MRKIVTTLSLAALFALGTAAFPLAAEEKMAEGKPAMHHASEMHKVVGEIVSVDATAQTFVVKETLKQGGAAKEMTFSFGEKGKVMTGGKAAMFTELKAGDSVTVHYHQKGDKIVAHEIMIAKSEK